MLSRSDGVAWSLVLAIGLVDAYWLGHVNFTLVGFGLIASCLAVLAVIAVGYGATGRSRRLAGLAYWTAFFMCASGSLAVLSYLAATLGAPLRDAELKGLDAALGFDWLATFRWLAAHPWLLVILGVAYTSFLPQIVATLVYFALRGEERANRELVWTLMLGALATVAVSAFYPASCSPDIYGPLSPDRTADLAALNFRFEACGGPDLILLRAGGPSIVDFSKMVGIVALPSFHTIVAILLVYAHRRQRWLLRCSLALNSLMLVSIPPMCGHYLMDVLAGVAIAGVIIVAARRQQAASRLAGFAAEPVAGPG